jgi:hypothetical protein
VIFRNDQELDDLVADGKITDDDADAVRDFAEFLRAAGPPARKGDDIQSGPLARLEHRPDLIRYALGVDE